MGAFKDQSFAYFGQYQAGEGWFFRLDPRSKLLLVAAFILAAFRLADPLSLGLLAIGLCALFVLAQFPVRLLIRQFRTVGWLFAVIFLLYWFFSSGQTLLGAGSIGPSKAGAVDGLRWCLKLFVFVFSGLLFTGTTSPLDLVDSLLATARFLGLGFARRWLEEIGLIFYLAFGFVPLFAREAVEIKKEQTARGASFDGPFYQRLRKNAPLVFPLIVNSFRRAEEKAVALEARGFGLAPEPSLLEPRQFSRNDWWVTVAGLILGVSVVV
jgi:energy-coupling factor transport system permease protein